MSKKPALSSLILLALLGLIILGIVLMAALNPPEKEEPESVEAAMAVTTLQVSPTTLADTVQLPARIEARINTTLAAEQAGRITRLLADRGDTVQANQLLMQIDNRVQSSALKQARIAAENARKNLKRNKELKQSGAVSQSEFDRIEQEAIHTASQLDAAQIALDQCRTLAPVAGTINDRLVDIGEYVQPGTPVFQLVDTSTVKVVIQVPERDIFSIKLGESIDFSVRPLPDEIFEGAITFIAAQADARNNAFRTELTVENPNGILRPGMIAQVAFTRGSMEQMVALPISAVLPSKGDHIVYLAKEGQAVRRKVLIDRISGEQALIAHGLEAGDLVILEGNRTLSDGQRVEVLEQGHMQ